jgi:NADPH:quinone reductase-like Zn-dependent oxidoreductase
MRRVQYQRQGGPEVLEVSEVDPPHAGPGEVRVQVRTAGLNPLDAKIFSGAPTAQKHEVGFPSGNGNDFAGVVDEVGEGVTELRLGDVVLGGLLRQAQAEAVVIPADRVVVKPDELSLEQAGALDIVARTAWASVASLELGAQDTVLVSAAAGGVGVVAAQLARRTGATVIGTAGEENHEFLRSLGVIPVAYGPGVTERVHAAAATAVTAVLDNHGRETVQAGLDLGVPAARINSIADYAAVRDLGVAGVGASGAGAAELAVVADLVGSGAVRLPVEAVYPLEQVQEAYRHLGRGHLRGKILLTIG